MNTLTITTIQTHLHWENREANCLMLEDKIRNIGERTEIVILPEMFSTGFSMNVAEMAETMNGETVIWMSKMAEKYRVVLTGSVMIAEEGKFYNRMLWVLPTGEYGYYDKRHLFAFAGEDQFYTAGQKRKIASVKGWKINLQVCYDLRFPVWARQKINHTTETTSTEQKNAFEYDVIIYVANWPEKRSHAWKTLLCARAIENQCYVVGVNRVGYDGNNISHSGDSMIIDPLGEPLVHLLNQEDVSTITLDKEKLEETRKRLPFLNDGDKFIIM
jgi:predicted amidohydrolase